MISPLGILFFGFIIVSYFVGIWVGTKIKKPKIIVKRDKENNTRHRQTPLRRR